MDEKLANRLLRQLTVRVNEDKGLSDRDSPWKLACLRHVDGYRPLIHESVPDLINSYLLTDALAKLSWLLSTYGFATHRETPGMAEFRHSFFYKDFRHRSTMESPLVRHVELLHEAGICERSISIAQVPDYENIVFRLQHELIRTQELLHESKGDDRSVVKTRERIMYVLRDLMAEPKNKSEEMIFHMLRTQLERLDPIQLKKRGTP